MTRARRFLALVLCALALLAFDRPARAAGNITPIASQPGWSNLKRVPDRSGYVDTLNRAALCTGPQWNGLATNGTTYVSTYDAGPNIVVPGQGTYTMAQGGCVVYTSTGFFVGVDGFSSTTVPASCPANSSPNGSPPTSCTCSSGYEPNGAGNACQPVNHCVAGQRINSGYFDVGTDVTVVNQAQMYCSAGCEYFQTGAENVVQIMVAGNKKWMARMGFQSTGNLCSGAPAVPTTGLPNPPAPTCGAGQSGGTVNGQWTCFDQSTGNPTASVPDPAASQPNGSSTTTGTTTTTTNPNGSVTTITTNTTTIINNNGTPAVGEQTTTTTCDSTGKNCSTTTTVTGAGAGPSGNGGAGGENSCPEGTDKVACMELGSGGGGPGGGGDQMTTENRDLAITPDGGWSHSMACPADKVVNTHFVSLTVPFGMLCTAADMGRPIVIAVGWMTAILGFIGLARKNN